MIEAAFARLDFARSIALGTVPSVRSLQCMVEAARASTQEFGIARGAGAFALSGAAVDENTRRWIAERGFRRQATRAARDTPYYAELFQKIGCDPTRITFEQIGQVPVTTKEALREQPDAFVSRTSRPFLCIQTTGTTGVPARVSFSQRELDIFACTAALTGLVSGDLRPDDIVAVTISLRASLATTIAAGICARIGASVYLNGQIDPAATLRMLSMRHHLPGKPARTSFLLCYASYLGELVEAGRALGYGPKDFGVRAIRVTGEIVTQGLLDRARALFGSVEFLAGYAAAELIPLSGRACSEDHLHFLPSAGLVEVKSLDGNGPAAPGEPGTIVATPFAPYRETTRLLRYDTQDVVDALPSALSCNLRNLPAVTKPRGRFPLSVQHDGGWTFQRDVMEAVERFDAVPLPARFGFWRVPGGVAVELFAPSLKQSVKSAVAAALEENGIPLRALHVVDDPRLLRKPLPVRADLRETLFERGGSDSPVLVGAV